MARSGTVLLALALAIAAGAALAAACAAGTAEDSLDDAGPEGDDASAAGADAHNDTGAANDAGDGVDTGPAFDAAFDPDALNGDGGPDGGASCAAPNTCANALDIGSVSGDTSSPAKTETGFASKWFMVNVTEDDSSPLGKKLRVTASLTSPPGANFDVYVYVDYSSGSSPTTRACTNASAQSTNTSGVDSASYSWGEGTIANNTDDGRIASIEVRYVSGTCDPNSKWTLVVSGD
jgi:hypothetical protein